MTPILQMQKKLSSPPVQLSDFPSELDGLVIRHYTDPADIGPWIELRQLAFAKSRIGLARWENADFEREFLQKPWWQPERMWLAELPPLQCTSEVAPSLFQFAKPVAGKPRLIGAITWSDRILSEKTIPAVNWLMVSPLHRRCGLAKKLLNLMEISVWNAGFRQIQLETHIAWAAAVNYMRSMDIQSFNCYAAVFSWPKRAILSCVSLITAIN